MAGCDERLTGSHTVMGGRAPSTCGTWTMTPSMTVLRSAKNAMSATPLALPPRKALIPAEAGSLGARQRPRRQAWSKFLVYLHAIDDPHEDLNSSPSLYAWCVLRVVWCVVRGWARGGEAGRSGGTAGV
jgi:hypothetical protein